MTIYTMLSPDQQAAMRNFRPIPKSRKKSLRSSLRSLGVERFWIHYPNYTVRAILNAWMEQKDIQALSAALNNKSYTLSEGLIEVSA